MKLLLAAQVIFLSFLPASRADHKLAESPTDKKVGKNIHLSQESIPDVDLGIDAYDPEIELLEDIEEDEMV
jgi:hypothetical protein